MQEGKEYLYFAIGIRILIVSLDLWRPEPDENKRKRVISSERVPFDIDPTGDRDRTGNRARNGGGGGRKKTGLSLAKNFNRYLGRPPNNISAVVAGAHGHAAWLSLSKMPPRDLYAAFWLPSRAARHFFPGENLPDGQETRLKVR